MHQIVHHSLHKILIKSKFSSNLWIILIISTVLKKRIKSNKGQSKT